MERSTNLMHIYIEGWRKTAGNSNYSNKKFCKGTLVLTLYRSNILLFIKYMNENAIILYISFIQYFMLDFVYIFI